MAPDKELTSSVGASQVSPAAQLSVSEHLAQQNPVHGLIGWTFDQLGGSEAFLTWAEENYTEFVKIMMKLAPPAIPKGQSGGIHLHLHHDLEPGALDIGGVTIEHESD